MTGNCLLQTDIGEYPTITSICFRNLYQHQKLMFIELEPPLPPVKGKDNLLNPISGIKDKPGLIADPQYGGPHVVQDTSNVFPVLAFLSTGLVVLFLLNQYYRSRSRPKRKRPRPRKLQQLIYGAKVPGVWWSKGCVKSLHQNFSWEFWSNNLQWHLVEKMSTKYAPFFKSKMRTFDMTPTALCQRLTWKPCCYCWMNSQEWQNSGTSSFSHGWSNRLNLTNQTFSEPCSCHVVLPSPVFLAADLTFSTNKGRLVGCGLFLLVLGRSDSEEVKWSLCDRQDGLCVMARSHLCHSKGKDYIFEFLDYMVSSLQYGKIILWTWWSAFCSVGIILFDTECGLWCGENDSVKAALRTSLR